jgi:hypothetical protein
MYGGFGGRTLMLSVNFETEPVTLVDCKKWVMKSRRHEWKS